MAINQEILNMADIIKDTVPTDRIYLFGSYAYGAPNSDSDYDFYVVLSDEDIRPYDAIVDIYRALHNLKNRNSVDILALPVSKFDDRRSLLTLEKKVASEGILLYEHNEYSLRMA